MSSLPAFHPEAKENCMLQLWPRAGHGWPAEGSVLDPGFAYKWGDGVTANSITTTTVGKQRRSARLCQNCETAPAETAVGLTDC